MWPTTSERIAAGGSCGRPRLEEPPREWEPGGLSSENQWNPRESEGTLDAEEGSRKAKTTEFRKMSLLYALDILMMSCRFCS